MAASKPPYDPVKTVEAMFMGSVARIAYVMKDPVNFAPATKAVLAETAKKFHDALDDCEIQILNAKWYLERQLAANRARREAKARDDSASSAKRKRDEVQEVQDKAQHAEGENAPKRVKTQEPEEAVPPPPPQPNPQQPSPVQKPAPQPAVAPSKPTAQPAQQPRDKPATAKPPDKPKVSVTTDVKPPQPPTPPATKSHGQPKPPEPLEPPERTMTQTTTDDFPKPTPQDTPASGTEAFNFESMFGEPSAEMMDSGGNDMTFDLDNFGGDGYGGDSDNLNLQDSSLNSLLPGLESYANQTGDDGGFGMPGPTNNGVPPGNDLAGEASQNDISAGQQLQQQQQQQQPPPPPPANLNDFSLPQLGPNEFDDFLNANDMSFGDNINLDGDGMMNMDNLDNINVDDFDSMFS
ncbi:hypothetical protein G647_07867 [Cladophialophora carrionii CBS 160.54]|uniref:Uncharacterized protein n=1 Tax=Cladophialophora carrionii CBS 160.54 TaxID=1279043 RepID=V9D3T1_9EURO|nr:uncharacterized protein G647_07867 [Cladophialophora carrionii CBS 160.54]ETI21520.1 hypothetical protein G647_07867 [Cladophialophora carrionii CBS 160.54]